MTSAGHATVRRDHAVVIGASVAGLLAARALGDTFSRVTVIDRDVLPDGPDPRKGVPQSRQLHILLARGAEALDELFPGFSEEMTAAGVPRGDAQVDLRTHLDGRLLRPAPSGIIVFGVSRPLIERMIRTRVAALEGIEIVDSTDVLGLVTDMDRRRVTGVQVRRRTDDAEESTVDADLVVDASGRGSRARVWLRELGYPQPPTSNVRPDVVYVTRHYRREPQHLDGHSGSAMVPFPGLPRGGGVLREEGGRFAVVLFGLIGEEPPLDDGGMAAYAETLGGPDAAEIIRSARPLDEPVRMRYPASVRHHYEKLDRHPNGFLIMGDALCNFNPTYGQGMTVAAIRPEAS
ncbi:FAD-dependent monooxygenase [Streptosporangium subroseum]|uniref:FAD-dependent oxidoreductase n=1 Tax=Streptosporangium subroseum TaxID=106412 RepID=UPI003443B149